MKRYRNLLGLSQMALAERVGCSTTLIGNIEIGKRFPSGDNINRIAQALEVQISDLFGVEEPPSMRVLSQKQELKSRFAAIMGKAIDELFS